MGNYTGIKLTRDALRGEDKVIATGGTAWMARSGGTGVTTLRLQAPDGRVYRIEITPEAMAEIIEFDARCRIRS